MGMIRRDLVCALTRVTVWGVRLLAIVATVGCSAGSTNESRASAGSALESTHGISAIWVNTGEDKVTQHDLRVGRTGTDVRNSIWDGKTVSLFAGRNEVVAFNLILECLNSSALDVTVECSSLKGPDGGLIESRAVPNPREKASLFDYRGRNIELFYVRYLQIRGVSVLAYEHYDERHVPERMRRKFRGQGRGIGGWNHRPDHDQFYPDIAVPIELHPRFDIAVGTNQSIWCDVFVPEETRPGIYQGHVIVRYRSIQRPSGRQAASGSEVVEATEHSTKVPIELNVRGYTLPNVPSAKTMVYCSDENINRRYLGEPYPEPGTPQYDRSTQIVDRHFQLAHRHKLSMIDEYKTIALVESTWRHRLDGSLFTSAFGYDGIGVGVGNNVYSIATYGHWPWKDHGRQAMWRNTDEWVRWFDAQNFEDTDCFLYLIDESQDFETIEKWSAWVDQNPGPGRRIPTMATITAPNAMAHTPSLDVVTSTITAGLSSPWRRAVKALRDRGPSAFLLYNGWRPASGTFTTEDDGVALRQVAWSQFKMSVRRWFAWESTYYNNYQADQGQTNVFRQAQVFGARSRTDPSLGETGWNYNNGDGVLFYPGTDRVFPGESYQVSGPFVSLRLKHWRRGIQDVDYLTMAARKYPNRVQRLVQRMIPKVLWELDASDPNDPTWVKSDISWSTNPDDWEAARRTLADWIEEE